MLIRESKQMVYFDAVASCGEYVSYHIERMAHSAVAADANGVLSSGPCLFYDDIAKMPHRMLLATPGPKCAISGNSLLASLFLIAWHAISADVWKIIFEHLFDALMSIEEARRNTAIGDASQHHNNIRAAMISSW